MHSKIDKRNLCGCNFRETLINTNAYQRISIQFRLNAPTLKCVNLSISKLMKFLENVNWLVNSLDREVWCFLSLSLYESVTLFEKPLTNLWIVISVSGTIFFGTCQDLTRLRYPILVPMLFVHFVCILSGTHYIHV